MSDGGDNRPVPDDPYAVFARFYDLEFASYDEDLDFYRTFALEAGGPVLELGCGSGRVLRALRDINLPLTGVDSSPAMLEIARQRLGGDVQLVRCNMEEVGGCDKLPDHHFWLALCAINTFLHLDHAESQLVTLRGLRRKVVAGGLLLLDVMQPDPTYLATIDGRVLLEFSTSLENGDRLDKWVSRWLDLASQTIRTLVYFDTTENRTRAVTRLTDEYLMRYIHRFELEHLLARAGWDLIAVYGSYDLEPLTSDSERMIALATWNNNPEDREG